MFKSYTTAALVLLAISASACTTGTIDNDEATLGTLASPLAAIDAEVDALYDARVELVRGTDKASDRADLDRLTDAYRSDAQQRLDRIGDLVSAMSDCQRDGERPGTDAIDRFVSDMSDAVVQVDKAQSDAAAFDGATDALAKHDEITFVICESFERDVSDLRRDADTYSCDVKPQGCDDDLGTDDC